MASTPTRRRTRLAAAALAATVSGLTAEPSACNASGNAREIVAALPRGEHVRVAGAVHVDAEWPTSWIAEVACGRASDDRRREFARRATEALREALGVRDPNGLVLDALQRNPAGPASGRPRLGDRAWPQATPLR